MSTSVAPDVVLLDLAHVENVASLLTSLGVAAPTLALATDDVQASDARSAAATGVVFRDSAPESLEAALRAVSAGLHVTDARFANVQPSPRSNGAGDTLTPREHEVLDLIAEGLPNKTIAMELGLSEHTVKFHVTAVMSKLEAQSRAEAVAEGFRRGLIAL